EVMKAANVSDADIATDLNQQNANEDAAVEPAGGWTAANVASSVGGVSVKTKSPTAIGSDSATLSGTIEASSTSTTPKFEYGTTTSLGTTVSGGSASTGTINASASLTGLAVNTTYYYRVIGEIGSADSLGTYYGDIMSFTTGKSLRTVTAVTSASTVTLSGTANLSTTLSAGSAGTTTFTIETGSLYCSISGSTLTASASNTGTCTIRADDAGNETYSASTSTSISITVTSLTTRTLTIDAASYSGTPYAFDVGTKPTITSTASAGVGTKSYSSSTTSVCTIDSSSGLITFVDAGTCTITASISESSPHASATSAAVDIVITALSRTLTLSGDSGPYTLADSPPTMSASASAGAGTKSYSSSTTSVCTVNSSSGVVAFVDAGTCTISSSITANAGYSSASSSSRSFTITATPRTLTIDPGSYNASYSGDATPPTISSTPSAGGGTKSYSSSTTSVCTINSSTGAVTIVDAGTCTITASITSSSPYASATSSSISFSITSAPTTTTSSTTTTVASGGGGGGGGGGRTTTTTAPSTTTTIASATATSTSLPSTTTTVNPRRITICHATAAGRYVQITVDRNGLNGHGNHDGDIIPAPEGGCGSLNSAATSTTVLESSGTGTTLTPLTTTTVVARTTVPPGKISICHATGAGTFVQINVDRSGLNGHGNHIDDIIPAPADGCPYSVRELALRAITTTTAVTNGSTPSTTTTLERGKITICHATSAGFHVEITVDRSGLNGHGGHEGDIIPAPASGCPKGIVVSTTVPRTTVPPGKITICHATAAGFHVEITVDRNGLNGHGGHEGDIIPAPRDGCPSRVERLSEPSTTTTLPRGKVAICHALGGGKFTRLVINRSDLSEHDDHINDIVPAPAGGCPGDPTSSTTTTTTTIPCLDEDTINNFDESPSLTEGLKVTSNSVPDDPNSGTIKISSPSSGPGVSLSGVESTDPNVKITVKSSGVDYNKSITWMNEGFGLFCWKLEPFGDRDYVYTLPSPPTPPDTRYSGLAYSTVIVKAGSLTTTDPNYQVNTLFYNPEPGSGVFADVNKNGISDPGGFSGGTFGDKSISHIILCVGEAEFEPVVSTTTVPASSTTAAFLTTTTTINWSAPFCSATTTTIRTSTSTSSTTSTLVSSSSTSTSTTTTTTTTIPSSSTSTTIGGSSTSTTVAGSTTTSTIGTASTTTTTVSGTTTTTIAGSTTTTAPGSSSTSTTIAGSTTTTTIAGATTTTAPGSSSTSTTIAGDSTTTTIAGSTTTTSPVVPTTSGPGSPTPETPIEFLVQAESVPESGMVDLVLTLTDGATSEVVFLRVNVEKFEVVADSLPVTGIERWSDSQRTGWYMIAFGLFFMLIPLRKRAALRR
ncbi:MAG: hypothetical protein RIS58_599, partial [Actinomycetota bacterium]